MLNKREMQNMSPEREADCIKRIIEASRANRRAPPPPTVIDPAKWDMRKNGTGEAAAIARAWAERRAAVADVIALLTMLEQTTQSRSIAERCAAAKRVLG